MRLQERHGFRFRHGQGRDRRIGGRRIAVGNAALLKDHGVASADLETARRCTATGGRDGALRGGGRQAAGIIAVADPIKATTLAALEACARGIRIVMLTGDNRKTAQAVAAQARHH